MSAVPLSVIPRCREFTGSLGVYCTVEETVRSFAEIIDGKCDDLPEQAFRFAGTIEDVRERACKIWSFG